MKLGFEIQAGQESGVFSEENLVAVAENLGLDGTSLRDCLNSGRVDARVSDSTKYAFSQGYEGTPTYEVNGRPVSGAVTIDRWDELFRAYEAELAQPTAVGP